MEHGAYSKTKLMERLHAYRQQYVDAESSRKKKRKAATNGPNSKIKEGILQKLHRESAGVDKILDLLPKIEGITYSPELSCFKSSVPSRYTRRPIVEYFSTKRYSVRDAWLMSVYHLYTNISNLIFKKATTDGLLGASERAATKAARASTEFIMAHTPERVHAPVEEIEWSESESLAGSEAESLNGTLEDPTDPHSVADSLKPWPKNVYWIPSISRWRTFYHDNTGVRHTKTFTPAVFGGVKKAYEAAVEFCEIINNIGQVTVSNVRKITMVQKSGKHSARNDGAINGKLRRPNANGSDVQTEERVTNHGITEFNSHIKQKIIEDAAVEMEQNGVCNADLREEPPKRSPRTFQEAAAAKRGGRCEETDSTTWEDIIDEIVVSNVEVKREENAVKTENVHQVVLNDEVLVKLDDESYDTEFLLGLDEQGLFIPIPADWTEY